MVNIQRLLRRVLENFFLFLLIVAIFYVTFLSFLSHMGDPLLKEHVPASNVPMVKIVANNCFIYVSLVISGVLSKWLPRIVLSIVAVRFSVSLIISLSIYTKVAVFSNLVPFAFFEVLAYAVGTALGQEHRMLRFDKSTRKGPYLILLICGFVLVVIAAYFEVRRIKYGH